jgi:16S rRNA (guanine966-N2)-methyltransferase
VAISLLGGRARGFQLQAPPENITRPTSVLLKRRLFDWRQVWDDYLFIDLCAGSGSMGLEALSRGAQEIWLNEINRVAQKVLEKNVVNFKQKMGLLEGESIHQSQLDFRKLLPQLAAHPRAWGEKAVIFFDPPYEEHQLYEELWDHLKGFQGEIWIESDEQKGVSLAAQRQRLNVIKEVSQGQHWLLVGKL